MKQLAVAAWLNQESQHQLQMSMKLMKMRGAITVSQQAM